MRRLISFSLYMVCFVAAFTACKKSDVGQQNAKQKTQPDVYVAGTLNTKGAYTYTNSNATTTACYWKNGKQVVLNNGSDFTTISGIAVSDTDVYVSGNVGSGFYGVDPLFTPKYWKNAMAVTLGSAGQSAHAAGGIVVSGTNVYIGGSTSAVNSAISVALYWQNGQPIPLSNPLNTSVRGASIAVSSGDVYVAGILYSGTLDPTYACYWKQGQLVKLTNPRRYNSYNTITQYAQTYGIALSGNDLYVCGYVLDSVAGGGSIDVACYWQNGQFTALNNNINSMATCITTSGNDVYVGGYIGSTAGYWKNGQWVAFGDGSSWVSAITIYNGDVYVCGKRQNGVDYMAGYWKNGQWVALASVASDAAGIVVK